MKEKCVVVTGGSGAIGRGLVLAFAKEGCDVVIATRDRTQGEKVTEAARALGGRAVVIPTDVSDWNAVEAMANDTKAHLGKIDVLVNNAGGPGPAAPFLNVPRAQWQSELALNTRGVLHCTRAVGEHMVARGSGTIVNITSNSALSGVAGKYLANYAGTKGYVIAFSKALAHEWGPLGIRINCISPGWTLPWSPTHVGAGSAWQQHAFQAFGGPEEMARRAECGELFNAANERMIQPIRRLGRPEDIADLAVFLASDRAKHITGQLISVSGGQYMP